MARIEGTSKGRAARRGTVALVAAGASAAVVLGAGGVAAASAGGHAPTGVTTRTATAMTSATATATAGRPPADGHPALQRLLRHTMEAQFVVRTKGGGHETFQYDRGVLRSVTSTSITITPAATPSGTISATITSTTRFKGLPESQLQPGDHVALLYQGGNAVVVGAKAPKPAGSSSSTSG